MFGLYAVLFLSCLTRIINLNYNSPFNDEAIYIVLGRLGVFQFDWYSYNASQWVAGSIYIYPSITAISSMVFGIAGSRFINVLFMMITLIAIFLITHMLTNRKGFTAATISAALLGGSSVSYYISRLATYDMPSFFFLILSVYFLIVAQHSDNKMSIPYFFSSVFLRVK